MVGGVGCAIPTSRVLPQSLMLKQKHLLLIIKDIGLPRAFF